MRTMQCRCFKLAALMEGIATILASIPSMGRWYEPRCPKELLNNALFFVKNLSSSRGDILYTKIGPSL